MGQVVAPFSSPPPGWADRSREAFLESGLTLKELGVRMGFSAETARLCAWQFLYRTADPNVSDLGRFARAIDRRLATLLA
jgi:hypothetical protein